MYLFHHVFLHARHVSSFVRAILLNSFATYIFFRARHTSLAPYFFRVHESAESIVSVMFQGKTLSGVVPLELVQCCGSGDQCSFLRLTWGRKPLMPYVPEVHAVPVPAYRGQLPLFFQKCISPKKNFQKLVRHERR